MFLISEKSSQALEQVQSITKQLDDTEGLNTATTESVELYRLINDGTLGKADGVS